MDKPKKRCKVLVLLPVLNEEMYIERAIESLKIQYFQDWILCAQDNHSDDKTFSILTSAAENDQRIRVFSSVSRLSAAENWNLIASKALEEVESEYVVWFSGDDFFVSENYFSKLVEVMEKNENRFPVAPNFLLQSEQIPSNFKNFLNKLDSQDVSERLRNLCDEWLNVCGMYAFYNRRQFESTLTSSQGRLTNYLGSDWWWVYSVVSATPILNCPEITYRKTHHEAGWRHSNRKVMKRREILIQKYKDAVFRLPKFIYNHFYLQRYRFSIIEDNAVRSFLMKSFIRGIRDFLVVHMKIFSGFYLISKFFRTKKKSA
jgi:glycosyltransferase involved in cell wall biosynthesis